MNEEELVIWRTCKKRDISPDLRTERQKRGVKRNKRNSQDKEGAHVLKAVRIHYAKVTGILQ